MRKSSVRVTLVLIGAAALTGCGRDEEVRRDVYKSREDCLADWGNKPEDCTPATEKRHAGSGFFYGPLIYGSALRAGSGSAWTQNARPGSRSIGSSTAGAPSRSGGISRGGFGSSGRSSVS
jgi:uncharacterized protein YgiB involved in biofilm formation